MKLGPLLDLGRFKKYEINRGRETTDEDKRFLTQVSAGRKQAARVSSNLSIQALFGGCGNLLKKLKSNPAHAKVSPEVIATNGSNWKAGMDGYYYSNPNGILYRYDPTINEAIKAGLSHVDHIKLGADNNLYVCIDDRIVKLEKDGYLSDKGRALNQHVKHIKDFAISSDGNELFVLDKNGKLFHRDLKNGSKECEITPNNTEATLKSIATTFDGGILGLDHKGNVWRSYTVNYKDAVILDEWSKRCRNYARLENLETLPDGRVAGRDINGRLMRPCECAATVKKMYSWDEVQMESLSKSAFQKFHKKLAPPGGVELTTFAGGPIQTEPVKKSSQYRDYIKKVKKNPIPGIKKRYRNLAHFAYEKGQPPGTAKKYATERRIYDGMLKSYLKNFDQLAFENGRVDPAICAELNKLGWDTREKTIRCVRDLMTSKETSKNNFGDREAKSTMEEAKLQLHQIGLVCKSIHGPEDIVAMALDKAVEMLAEAIKQKRDVNIKSSKLDELVVEYGILAETIKKLTKLGQPDDNTTLKPEDLNQRRWAILDVAKKKRRGSLASLLSRYDINNIHSFGNIAETFDAIENIFRNKEDLLPTLIRKTAELEKDESGILQEKSVKQIGHFFRDLINSMKVGESISLVKSKDRGFNTDVLRLVFAKTVAAASGGGSIVAWAIPILDAGYLRDCELKISKTEKGIDIEILNAQGRYGTFGARSGAGIPFVKDLNPKKHGTFWEFLGLEIAIKGKHTTKKGDGIKFTIDDNKSGNIGDTVRDILSGKADLFKLMKRSAVVESSCSKATEKDLNISGVAVAAAGTQQPNWYPDDDKKNLKPSVFKVLTALVPEFSLNYGSKKMKSTSKCSTGNITKEQGKQEWGLNDARVNLIGVNVLETDWIAGATGTASAFGRAGFPGILPGVMLSKVFAGLGATLKSSVLELSKDGRPETISVNLTLMNAEKIISKMDKIGNLRQTVPGLQKALEKLTELKKSGSVTINMELTPEAMSQLPENNNAQRIAEMVKLAKNLDNFRIKEINASHTRKTEKRVALPIPGYTRANIGKIETTSPSARIEFIYDKAELLEHGKSLLKTLSRFDDNVWGATQTRQERLTASSYQLENLVGALCKEVVSQHGGDMNAYNQKLRMLKAQFMQDVSALLLKRKNLAEAVDALENLFENVNNLRNQYMFKGFPVSVFEGPAILPSGKLFVKPDAGQFSKDLKVGSYDEIKQGEVGNALVDALDQLKRMDLQAIPARKLEKAKKEAFEKIDFIKRTINAATDVQAETKKELFPLLYALAARKPDHELFVTVKNMLKRLDLYRSPQSLADFHWIDRDLITMLEEVGIENTEQLYQSGNLRSLQKIGLRPSELPGELSKQLDELSALSDLIRLPDVSIALARLLVKADILDTEMIAESNPQDLHRRLIEAKETAGHDFLYSENIEISDIKKIIVLARRMSFKKSPTHSFAGFGSLGLDLIYKLHDAGITSFEHLYDATRSEPGKLDEKISLDENKENKPDELKRLRMNLLTLMKVADLLHIPGVNPEFAKLLVESGISSIEHAADYSEKPEDLYIRLLSHRLEIKPELMQLLMEAKFDTAKKIAKSNPNDLYQALIKINRQRPDILNYQGKVRIKAINRLVETAKRCENPGIKVNIKDIKRFVLAAARAQKTKAQSLNQSDEKLMREWERTSEQKRQEEFVSSRLELEEPEAPILETSASPRQVRAESPELMKSGPLNQNNARLYNQEEILNARLRSLNLTKVPVPYDGNCFYWAIGNQLGKNQRQVRDDLHRFLNFIWDWQPEHGLKIGDLQFETEDQIREVQFQIHDIIEFTGDYKETHMETVEKQFNQTLNDLKGDRIWAFEHFAAIAAECYRRPIQILADHHFDTIVHGEIYRGNGNGPDIVLIYNDNENHFNSTKPINGDETADINLEEDMLSTVAESLGRLVFGSAAFGMRLIESLYPKSLSEKKGEYN